MRGIWADSICSSTPGSDWLNHHIMKAYLLFFAGLFECLFLGFGMAFLCIGLVALLLKDWYEEFRHNDYSLFVELPLACSAFVVILAMPWIVGTDWATRSGFRKISRFIVYGYFVVWLTLLMWK
jgi:hypothetical protein